MRAVIGLAVLTFVVTANARAQGSRCAECHFANIAVIPAAGQLAEWGRSAHGRHNVGCERCHLGDPSTYQPVDAHRGIRHSRQPLSAVSRANLALTCAACHGGVVASFRLSTHAAGLASDRPGAPSCGTCHGAMAAQAPSSAHVEETCAGCHQTGSGRGAYGTLARQRIESLRGIEQTLTSVETAIAAVEERPRRNRLAAELLLARAAVRQAADAVHTFDFGVMDERRVAAQRRASDLVADLIGK